MISNPDLTQIDLQISINGVTEEDVDRMTRQLLSELRELEVESVKLGKGGPAPSGSKGDPITVGSIALEVLPVAIPAVMALVQAWITRGQGRVVKFKGKVGGGQAIEFEGSPEEFRKLLERLEKGKKGK